MSQCKYKRLRELHHHHKHQGLDQFDPFRLQSYNHTTTDHKEGEQLKELNPCYF